MKHLWNSNKTLYICSHYSRPNSILGGGCCQLSEKEGGREGGRGNRLTFHKKAQLFACFRGTALHEATHSGVGPLPHYGTAGSDDILSVWLSLSWGSGSQQRRGGRNRRQRWRRGRRRLLLVASEEDRESFARRESILGKRMGQQRKSSVTMLLIFERRQKREGGMRQRKMMSHLLRLVPTAGNNSKEGLE